MIIIQINIIFIIIEILKILVIKLNTGKISYRGNYYE